MDITEHLNPLDDDKKEVQRLRAVLRHVLDMAAPLPPQTYIGGGVRIEKNRERHPTFFGRKWDDLIGPVDTKDLTNDR